MNGDRPAAIALVVHESRADLERHLDEQLAVAEALGTKLVAVDNASADGSLELLQRAARSSAALEVVRMDRNRGYAAGVNTAFAAAPGADVLLINPDVALSDRGQLDRLAAIALARPRAAVVAPRLVGADGNGQPSARRYPSGWAMLGSLPAARGLPAARRAYDRYVEPSRAGDVTAVDWVIGAAMLITRRAFDAVGGWDERYFLYMEDADFCRRCNRAGWEVLYAPAIEMAHGYARASSAGDSVLRSPARRRHFAGLARFWASGPRSLVGLEGRDG